MTTQESACTLSDELSNNLQDLRTLLNVMDDQLYLYLGNRKLLGGHPNGELLRCCVSEVCGLLALSQTLLTQIDQRADTLADFLYHGEQSDNLE